MEKVLPDSLSEECNVMESLWRLKGLSKIRHCHAGPENWLRSVVLNQSNPLPYPVGDLAVSRDIFGCHSEGHRMLLSSNG